MNKNRINEYALLHGNKKVFDDFFYTENPWNLNGSQEQFRYKIVIKFIKKNFSKPDLKILEIGCAEGNFSEYLDKENFKTTAIDISEVAIERAKKKSLKNVNFICSEMNDFIQHTDIESYDIVLMMECYYYMSSEQRNIFLKELAKKINPETNIILTTPIRKKNLMFSAESRLVNIFHYRGFEKEESFSSIVLSLRGISGKLSEFIPTFVLKKFYFTLHKILFPFRVNQKLFVFKKI
ncbi:MAG: SAM-dependent methyltransferase [Ignavibacteriae bacterium]|nr:SAM-dependent methyltransferase [Ignavibacteriota bacterium]